MSISGCGKWRSLVQMHDSLYCGIGILEQGSHTDMWLDGCRQLVIDASRLLPLLSR